jgi:phosphoribosylformimino-5-aminoimidazole carboxamide ribotide isomerase
MIELVPAIDIIGGKCVRLSQGDYGTKTVYSENPLEIAKAFEGAGINRLHLVDLDGAKSSRIVNYKILEQIAKGTSLIIDFGGGLKTDDDLRIAFESGAAMVTGGSIAVKSPQVFETWLQKYGGSKIILGSDVKDKKIAVNGWLESTDQELLPFLKAYMQKGVSATICTDISKDGMLQGPAFELYAEIKKSFPSLYLIASGGISSFADIAKLDEQGIDSVIFGKAFYEGKISLKDLEKAILSN